MRGKLLGADDVLCVFGPFTLDLVTSTLFQDGVAVSLPNRSLELLAVLVNNRGRLVSKDELLAAVWPGSIVDENNLARHISNLRKVLGNDANAHDFIVTVTGRGYRFVAVVMEVRRADLHEGHEDVEQEDSPLEAASRRSNFVKILRHPTTARAVFGMLLVALSLVGVRGYRSQAVNVRETKLWRLTSDPGVQMEPAWSPDGRTVVYTADRDGSVHLWMQSVTSDTATRLTSSPAPDWQSSWSPDGRYLVFRSEREGGGLYVIPRAGGPEQRIADFGYWPQWSPAGDQILFYSDDMASPDGFRRGNLYLVRLDGQPPRMLLTNDSMSFWRFRVHWLPDGRRISILGNHRSLGWGFWTRSVDGANVVQSELGIDLNNQLRTGEVVLTDFAWSPQGNDLFLEGQEGGARTLWRVSVDPRTLSWRSPMQRLKAGSEHSTGLAVSPDGTKLAFSVRNEDTGLWAVPFDSAAGVIVGEGHEVLAEGADVPYDVSADGREIVYCIAKQWVQQLWRRSLIDGQDELLVSGQSIGVPRFSHDGQHVVFRRARQVVSEDAGVEQEVVMLAVDGGHERLLTSAEQSPFRNMFVPFDWSSDGSRILTPCKLGSERRFSICTLPVSGAPHAERAMQLLVSMPNRDLFQGQFSPNDRFVSFNGTPQRGSPGNSQVFVAQTGLGLPRAITDGRYWDDKPRWAPDGRTIYYISRRSGFLNVWGRRFDRDLGQPIGEEFRVTNFESARRFLYPSLGAMQFEVKRDQLVLPVTTASSSIWILESTN